MCVYVCVFFFVLYYLLHCILLFYFWAHVSVVFFYLCFRHYFVLIIIIIIIMTPRCNTVIYGAYIPQTGVKMASKLKQLPNVAVVYPETVHSRQNIYTIVAYSACPGLLTIRRT